MSPDVLAGPGWADHSEAFLSEPSAMEGIRVPGERRFANRRDTGRREINAELVESLRSQR